MALETTTDSIDQSLPLGTASLTNKVRMADEMDLPFDDEVLLAIRYNDYCKR